jgi:transcriptional regulator with XRE-family HTH domain
MTTIAQVFGTNLQKLRTRHGLTQKQLGALTKMSASFIGEMERGLKAPNLTGIVAIAWALRVSVEEMVAGFTTAGPR